MLKRFLRHAFSLCKKKIIEAEEEEGIKTRFDKKSMNRIIDRLIKEGKLKSLKPKVRVGNEEKEVIFFDTVFISFFSLDLKKSRWYNNRCLCGYGTT